MKPTPATTQAALVAETQHAVAAIIRVPKYRESTIVKRHRWKRSDIVERIELVIDHMIRHSNESLRLSELRAMVGISSSHFCSIFKSVTGFSPMELLTRLRMRRACGLLRDQSLLVKQVADIVGYRDAFYFSRMFKKVIGISPGRYRKKMLGLPRKKQVLLKATEPCQFSLRSPFEGGTLNSSEVLFGNGSPGPLLKAQNLLTQF